MSASTAGIGWEALDIREEGYNRHALHNTDMQMYIGSPDCILDGVKQPILLSYLDVVVQGYHTHFGKQGVADFFATTQNWDHPILHDRHDPQYPRAQQLSNEQRDLVDHHLENL
jgi:hypothetical protein